MLTALDAGISQVVILGAGYDCRALQLRKPGVRFFELDHPITQEDKKRRLAGLGLFSEEVTYLPVDLGTESVSATLHRAGHLSRRPSLFLCEGLLLYLSPKAVRQLFQSISERAENGSQIALSARVYPGDSSRAWLSRLVGVSRWTIGEPERSHHTRGEFENLIRESGFFPVNESLYYPGRRSGVGTLMIAATSGVPPRGILLSHIVHDEKPIETRSATATPSRESNSRPARSTPRQS